MSRSTVNSSLEKTFWWAGSMLLVGLMAVAVLGFLPSRNGTDDPVQKASPQSSERHHAAATRRSVKGGLPDHNAESYAAGTTERKAAPPPAKSDHAASQAAASSQGAQAESKAPSPEEKAVSDARALIEAGQIDEGIAQLQGLVDANPENYGAQRELGIALITEKGSAEQATPHLEQALQLDPKDHVVAFQLVESYLKSGKTEEGTQKLTELAAANPDVAPVQYATGDLLASQGDLKKAIPYFEEAARLGDKDGMIAVTVGQAYLGSGEPERAVEYLGQAIAKQRANLQTVEAKGGEEAEMARENLFRTRLEQAEALIASDNADDASGVVNELAGEAPDDPHVKDLQKRLAGGQ